MEQNCKILIYYSFNDLPTRALRILSLYLNLIWSYKASHPQAIKSCFILIFSFLHKKISCNVSPEAATGGAFCKSLGPATLLKKSLARVFSCEFCEISKNTFFTEHLWTTASVSPEYPFQMRITQNKIHHLSHTALASFSDVVKTTKEKSSNLTGLRCP